MTRFKKNYKLNEATETVASFFHDGIIQFHVVKFNGKIAFSVIKSKM